MDDETRQIIEQIHAAPYRCAIALTGGGAQAVGWLLCVPGGSRTIAEIAIPYHADAIVQFLRQEPAQFCSIETSRLLAQRSYERARDVVSGAAVCGVGCTASLASDRPKRGPHRLHVSVHEQLRTTTWTLELSKGARKREEEDTIVARALLNALAETFGIEPRLKIPLRRDEEIKIRKTTLSDPLSRFIARRSKLVCVERDGQVTEKGSTPQLLMPGSFNPLHQGHRLLAEVAAGMHGASLAFEISVRNVDKGEIEAEEVRRRLSQFTWRYPVWLTREPTFLGKSKLFPEATFIVGADTAQRLVMPKYYSGSEKRMLKALDTIRERGCRFLVAGRADANGRFQTLADVNVPAAFAGLFRKIPENDFRMDVSSTHFRLTEP